jgi:Fe-S cluster assembly protein SufB
LPGWASFLSDVDFGSAAGVGDAGRDGTAAASGDTEASYRAVREDLEAKGVRFLRTDAAVRAYPDLLRETLGTAVGPESNPFAALGAALWSGGSFVYVPPGVDVGVALQAEFRQDYRGVDAFEHTILIADRGSRVEFVEGCTAPVYTPHELHVSSIEVFVRPGANVRYVAVQNFAKRVDNLVTKRALVDEDASIEWVDANLGSRFTWKAPETVLRGPRATADVYGWALAGSGQRADIGGAVVHSAPDTRSQIVLRGTAHRDGSVALRPTVLATRGIRGAVSSVDSESLLLLGASSGETIPSIDLNGSDVQLSVGVRSRRLSAEDFPSAASAGTPPSEAVRDTVLAFAEVVTKRVPFEYAIEVNRLAELDLSGAIG